LFGGEVTGRIRPAGEFSIQALGHCEERPKKINQRQALVDLLGKSGYRSNVFRGSKS
jgi:hypothetical protein